MQAETPREVLARRVDKFTHPVLTAVCAALFFFIVPMLPGSPLLPALVGVGLGLYSVRDARRASRLFYLLAFAAVAWQLLGFGMASFAQTPLGGLAAFLLLVPMLVNAMNPRMSPSSLALTLLAVALMLTPEYVFSVPLVAAAVALDGLSVVASTVVTFVLALAPFLFIENALYFASLGGATAPPVVFGELTLLADNLRPALPGLNVFLTGIPKDFFYANSSAVAAFLTGRSYLMLVPLAVFALVFGASASVAGVLTALKDKLTAFARLSNALKTLWPVVVTVTMTAIFAVLLVLLSSASVGGYQAQLGDVPFAIGGMVAGAAVMGGALSTRVYLDEGLNAAVRAREGLGLALGEAEGLLSGLKETAAKVDALAPSVGLRVEEGVLEQYSSYLSDVSRQADASGADALNTWSGEIRSRIVPTLQSLPEQIRVKVINEVTSVSSLAESLNGTLEHLGVGARFPTLGHGASAMDTEEALKAYARLAQELKTEVKGLYAYYLEAAKALDALLDRTVSEPPVAPDVLLSTNDYVTAMRLLGEEYSMNLSAQYSDELRLKVAELEDRLRKKSEALGEEGEAGPFGPDDAKPLEAAKLLKKVDALVATLRAEAESAVADSTRLAEMVATLMPAATTVLKFATLAELDALKDLRRESKALGPALDAVSRYVARATKVLAAHRESGRKDEENLIVVAQYPLAWRVIHDMAATRPVISLAELPFQPDATHLYARIYSANEPAARYDEQAGAILITHA
ncbi:MAG: hypothetical protein JRM97_08750 [Nitrososphaerota archaeon]|nr:hypothetical protein [Nitrososphaerota archaeon]MDG7019668.1 hypothetical protein [Nitrososphaerota archaeon]MDG7032702.1 hypothetical protein [Nitrososphaerota archaeon]MDG7034054.1 hypothetical protein [Nitrososphaerota archaeon]